MDGPSERSARPILLIGMPGVGKSTVGPLLAARLGLPFHDSDELIEAGTGLDPAAFFHRHGEARFREEERRILARLLGGGPAVIAGGGGVFLDHRIRALALSRATAIWLDAPVEILAARLEGKAARPLLAGNPSARLAALKAERDPVYVLAPLRVDAETPPKQVADIILAALAEPAR